MIVQVTLSIGNCATTCRTIGSFAAQQTIQYAAHQLQAFGVTPFAAQSTTPVVAAANLVLVAVILIQMIQPELQNQMY